MGFKLYLKPRTNEERIADALAEVRAGLEHIKDPRVWGGYPDGCPDNANDEEEPGALIGLVLNLERCTRGDSTWQMAMAIEIAFSLGKIAAGGKANPGLLAKFSALEDAWRRGGDTGGGSD